MKYYRINGKKRKECLARGRGGMVISASPFASEAGIAVMKKGGNAFDAAVAVSLVLAVVEPACSGLGGNGFMTAYLAGEKKTVFLDFWTEAPGFATPENWAKKDPERPGAWTVGIPGEPAGLDHIAKKYGKLPLSELAKPAIKLARDGFPVSRLLAGDISFFRDNMLRYAEPDNVYLSRSWQEGDILKNPPLAWSLEEFARAGADAFYRGELTDRLIAGINRFGGQFTRDDFNRYRVRTGEPVRGTYRGYEIFSSNLPSSGGTHVVENLNMLENFPLSSWGFDSPERLFTLTEIFKKSFSDRAAYMGDPAYVTVPRKGLLSKDYAKKLAESITYGSPQTPAPGDPFSFESADTTHFSIVDAEGNMVAQTQTISAFFGSCIVPKGTGIFMNCQLNGMKEDAIKPYKRPISSTSPTLVFKDGKPFAVVGTPGANRIITTVTQLISNLADYGMSMEKALFAPRIFCDRDGKLLYEADFDPETIRTIKEMGQPVKGLAPLTRYMGGAGGILFEKDGSLSGAADPRRDGSALAADPLPGPVFRNQKVSYRRKRGFVRRGGYHRGCPYQRRKEWEEVETIY